MTYEIWFKKIPDGFAPEYADLTEYTKIGVLEGGSPRELEFQLRSQNNEGKVLPTASRHMSVGDVVVSSGQSFILTPTGHWALVQVTNVPT